MSAELEYRKNNLRDKTPNEFCSAWQSEIRQLHSERDISEENCSIQGSLHFLPFPIADFEQHNTTLRWPKQGIKAFQMWHFFPSYFTFSCPEAAASSSSTSAAAFHLFDTSPTPRAVPPGTGIRCCCSQSHGQPGLLLLPTPR